MSYQGDNPQIIQFPEGVEGTHDFGGSMELVRNANVVINGSGKVLKDRDGLAPRMASPFELANAEQVE